MNQVFNIAKMTILMTFRRGTLPAALIVIAVLSTVIFNIARSDGELSNELEIRLTYSYGMTYSILSLIIISLACFTIRSQLDAKNIHMLTSYPIQRKWIFLGQGIGVLFIGVLSLIVLVISLYANAAVLKGNYTDEQISEASDLIFNSRRKVIPYYPSKRDLTLTYAEKNSIDVKALNEIQWDVVYERALANEQIIEPGKSKSYIFSLGESPGGEKEEVNFNFRFQQAEKRNKINGILEISSDNTAISYKQKIEAEQYQFQKVSVPAKYIPADGNFTLAFTNTSDKSTILTRSGLNCSYQSGSFGKNLIKALISQVFHLSVVTAVGLTAGLGLTFSVATFIVIMLYVMSIMEGVIAVVAEELQFVAVIDFWDKAVMSIMEISLWVTKGLQPPDVISNISSGILLENSYLFLEWLPSVFVYGFIAVIIGLRIFENKELDKIQV